MAEKLFDLEKYARCARQCAAEGTVLLKNDGEVLPLKAGSKIALFGRSRYNYYKSGNGSGGLVNTRYVTGIYEALKADDRFILEENLQKLYDEWIVDHPFNPGLGWASEPWFQEEMPIADEIAANAAAASDVAIVLIGRTAGEDHDNLEEKGSWYLTDAEEEMLSAVTKHFKKTVVLLNTGNIMDMNWVSNYKPSAVAYVWQGGQEGGNGVLDVLTGKVNPSGRLTDTIAKSIEDYPSTANFGAMDRNLHKEDIYVGYRYFETFAKEKVLYPFGFGLSYTTFEIKPCKCVRSDGVTEIKATVKNTGKTAGREVVQAYLCAPQGVLGKPLRSLIGFAKTGLLNPDEAETVSILVPDYTMASYDDSGKTGFESSYVLESGEYIIYVGADVRNNEEAGRFTLPETLCLKKHSQVLAPVTPFERMLPKQQGDVFTVVYEEVPLAKYSAGERRLKQLPEEIPTTGDKGIKLKDVAEGKASMDSFIAQLSDEDLMCIVRGEGMSSPKVTAGCGGAFGGVTDSLLKFGIPIACCTDGPSGIRMDSGRTAFSMPNGACLASTWDEALIEELYACEGLELRKNKIDVLLGPGMNLHRHPLNGRNFEYFSEDPLQTGKCAAAELRGMHRYGVTGTIKHFAMNTQEKRRRAVENIASERAIRELYLRGYEIAINEGNAHAVMTSYGPVNGFYTASNYDLVTEILRNEWGFDGVVMTDWWAAGNDEGKPGNGNNMAAMIRAQNDLYMVTANAEKNTNRDNSEEALREGTVTRAEYQRSAANICRFIIGKPVFARYTGVNNEIDLRLEAQIEEEQDEDELAYEKMTVCRMTEENRIDFDCSAIDTSRGKKTMYSIGIRERGIYRLHMDIRAKASSSLAQIPLTIHMNKEVAGQITLTGEDTEWRTVEITLKPCLGAIFLKLFFAEGGMEIKNFGIDMLKSVEQRIKQAPESQRFSVIQEILREAAEERKNGKVK